MSRRVRKLSLGPGRLSIPGQEGHSACETSKNFTLLEPLRGKFRGLWWTGPRAMKQKEATSGALGFPTTPTDRKTSSAGAGCHCTAVPAPWSTLPKHCVGAGGSWGGSGESPSPQAKG